MDPHSTPLPSSFECLRRRAR
ncbi:hypothetical protein P4O66_001776 [Electrophorus voltai]|uniref:Uncharacterized protein n=1 Tax=Electrophorus voltai TaxID=2609070 RepID=A0AAD8Z610_9TELE|nr:hypothetical protein P4O66_001776 [Electrophorus voltai]